MTWKTKIKVMITVTALMTIGFLMMSRVPIGRIILCVVWSAHIIMFTFVIRTYRQKSDNGIDKNT